jgi:mRNA interferase MazF
LKPGEVYWVELPSGDGREQAGRRPAIVLQDDTVAAASPMVLLVPLTSATAALRFPGTVPVLPTPENGLTRQSLALVFQLRAIDRRRVKEHVGTVSRDILDGLYRELNRLTGRTP